MITSTETKQITEALISFHKEVGAVKKDSTNPFFKSGYASLSAVLDAIKEPLEKNGLTFVQFPEADGLTTRLLHKSGEWFEANVKMVLAKNDPQGLGSALTYQRRYSLSSILGLVTEEDDDGNAASEGTDKEAKDDF